jgi:hypothetical protein
VPEHRQASPPPVRWDANRACLIFDWSSVLGHDCELVISSWQDGLTATTNADGQVESIDLFTIGDWLLRLDDAPIRSWMASFPDDLGAGLLALPDDRLALLALAISVDAAKDLLVANPPALGWPYLSSDVPKRVGVMGL